MDELLEDLRDGIEIIEEKEEYEYGRVGWIMNSEGNRIELGNLLVKNSDIKLLIN